MKKQASFSGPADYNTRRPYCVVTPSGPSVAYDVHSRWATRKAANNACDRASSRASVLTITQVNKADLLANDAEVARILSYGND